MLIPELVAGNEEESTPVTSDQAAMMDDITYLSVNLKTKKDRRDVEHTMKMKDTKVKAVTRPPNQITSPYACQTIRDGHHLNIKNTYNKNNCQVLEYRVHWYA